VPIADEVWRLQRGTDGESRFFQSFADQGHYRAKGGTRQGIYVASPSGRLLSSCNELDPAKVKATLEAGLAKWEQLPAAERKLAEGVDIEPRHRWEDSCPTDGLILTSVNRDLPPSLDAGGGSAIKWNRDHAWLSRPEMQSLVPAEPQVGATTVWPRAIVERLARFHLVDNVIGQTLPFAPEEIGAESSIVSEVIAVEGARVSLRLSGSTRALTDGSWKLGDNDWKPSRLWPRGYLAQLAGLAVFDLSTREFTSFELVSQGLRWGRAVNNGRREDGPSPIGHVFRLAGEGADREVPPAFVDLYGDWIVDPPTG
jgi:hypothetical protein